MGFFRYLKLKKAIKRMKILSAELQRLPEDGDSDQREAIQALKKQAIGISGNVGLLKSTIRNLRMYEEKGYALEIKIIREMKEDWRLILKYGDKLDNACPKILGDDHRSVTLTREIVSIVRQILDG